MCGRERTTYSSVDSTVTQVDTRSVHWYDSIRAVCHRVLQLFSHLYVHTTMVRLMNLVTSTHLPPVRSGSSREPSYNCNTCCSTSASPS